MAKNYLVDDNKNLVEGLSKEDIYTLLASAIKDKTLPDYDTDEAFITKLKDPVDGTTHKVAFVTQAKYNELASNGSLISNCLYYITDDTTAEDLETAIEAAKEDAVKEANENEAEGLAKKLDKGDWVEYQFEWQPNTDIEVAISLDYGTYICEIVAKGTADDSGMRTTISLGIFTLDRPKNMPSYAYLGARPINTFGNIHDISAWIDLKSAHIKGDFPSLLNGTYRSFIRFRKIAND